ncbi:MAG: FAD-binding oxidoreductase [Pseudomonadota bacterium]
MTSGLNVADAEILAQMASAIGADSVLKPDARYLEEPRGRYHGAAAAVLLPKTTEDVAHLMRICSEHRVGVIPYAGGTGLVGGQVSTDQPGLVLVSFERLNRIRVIDPDDNVLIAEAGMVLADVQAAASRVGRRFPLSLASEGSARIGGLLGTNAGGLNVLRYGNARELCLGVEAVLSDGSVFRGLKSVMKDNMGYDIRNLLIGSEGTLGLITAASLRLFPAVQERATAWMAVASVRDALELLALSRDILGGTISAFELMHIQGFDFLAETMPQISQPPRFQTQWAVLAEVEEGSGSGLEARFERLLELAMERGLVADGSLAQSEAQRHAFWNVRESIPEANRKIGSISSHDVSVPPSRIEEFLSRAKPALEALNSDIRINCFGHLGDGNLHYNVFPPLGRDRGDFENLRSFVKSIVHDLVHDLGGSIAAEHGVGRAKVPDLAKYAGTAELETMRRIKKALDPDGLLNPGAVIEVD